MSDRQDEENEEVVHYGSLEDVERVRQANKVTSSLPPMADQTTASMISMNVSHSAGERLEMDPKATAQDDLVAEFERKKRVRQVTISTDDREVKAQLRELGHPICYFGEGPADRRERLRNLVADMSQETQMKLARLPADVDKEKDDKEGTIWYHEGSMGLRQARVWLCNYSIPRLTFQLSEQLQPLTFYRAKKRLQQAKVEASQPESQRQGAVADAVKRMRSMAMESSQVGDARPLSYCEISPNGKLLATASWSGLCKLWTLPDCEERLVLRGHSNRACAITFHPQATLTLDSSACCLASSGQDGSVKLWNLESYDNSWRLWDLVAQEEILHQEGHSRPVYDVSFHPDGSLAATCGLDAYGRLWDLRTGRCIMFLEGHLKSVLSIDFSFNGFHLATGSEDHSCKIWDLRKSKCVYTIPAHNSLVSKVAFQKTANHYLMTASYDCTAKIWTNPTWTPLSTLQGHEGKLCCADVSPTDNCIVTASFDRTFKLWTPEAS